MCDVLPVRPTKGSSGLGWRCLWSTPGRELTWVSWPRKSFAEEGGDDDEEPLFWHSSSSQSEVRVKVKVALWDYLILSNI